MDKVVVITGPTAVGKTKLSIALAKMLQTEIINGDAYQVYQKMDIGTAKPTRDEQAGVIHHLLDYVDPSVEYSVARYQREVRLCIEQLIKKNKIPLIVGGSGLYIDSVIKDYRFEEEKHSFEESDELYNCLTNKELYKVLEEVDFELAQTIHPNNRKRVLRAIELGKSPVEKDSRAHREEFIYDTLLIFLNDQRDALYERINKRVDEMIENGLIQEVQEIGEKNFSLTSRAAIGYKECLAFFNDEISYEEMIELIKKNSRHYAKRQFTWFKNKTNALIVDINYSDFQKTIDQVYDLIIEFIEK